MLQVLDYYWWKCWLQEECWFVCKHIISFTSQRVAGVGLSLIGGSSSPLSGVSSWPNGFQQYPALSGCLACGTLPCQLLCEVLCDGSGHRWTEEGSLLLFISMGVHLLSDKSCSVPQSLCLALLTPVDMSSLSCCLMTTFGDMAAP